MTKLVSRYFYSSGKHTVKDDGVTEKENKPD